jgi:glutamate carboxypeptidase
MIDQLAALVGVESPSSDLDRLADCAAVVSEIGEKVMGAPPDREVVDGRIHLVWRFGTEVKVALIGHYDTVWPAGTLERWPFAVDDQGRATGPGAFDMKAGIVQLFHAVACLPSPDGVTVVLTADEELGSQTSRRLIESVAGGARAALVLEPSARGALKTARKGTSMYEVHAIGRSAHAGLEPEKGINATIELAHQVLTVAAMGRPEIGTTVTPTVASAGTTTNTVPAESVLHIDVRATEPDEQIRVDRAVRALAPSVPGAQLRIEGGINRPPLPASSSAGLYALAADVAGALGGRRPDGVAVGGASDGNFTAGIGVPTLDGLGADGDGAHAEGEYVVVSAMPERAALVAGLIWAVLAGPDS